MSDFLTQGVNGQRAFTMLQVSDFHALRSSGYTYSQTRIPQLIASIAKERFDIYLDSGDLLHGSYSTHGTMAQQWEVYEPLADHIDGRGIPRLHTIGNHDNIGNVRSEVRDLFGMSDYYYYYDVSGTTWRIIVLDSTVEDTAGEGPYTLGDTQRAWLSDLLAASTDKYICIVSHVPMQSVGAPHWYSIEKNQNPLPTNTYYLPWAQHNDAVPVLSLLRQYPNIKAWLSGHEHQWDDVRINDMQCRFLGCGAACAYYWNTENQWHYGRAGYRVLTFSVDGVVSYQNKYY